MSSSTNTARLATIIGLVVGAAGIATLWASGVEFPFYPPPGILILTAGALFIALAKWSWTPAVGTLLGLFIIVGFIASGTGMDNLTGAVGIGASIGTVIQLAGVAVATVAGVLAVRREYASAR